MTAEPNRDAGEEPDATADVAGAPPPQLEPLKVSVCHASLEHAPYRLLVGHYQGLPFTGAESQLNRRSEGRLERLLLAHQYPQRPGEIAILDAVDEAPPKGAIVLGLGPSGELAPLQLRDLVTRALLRYALNELDRRLASPPAIGEAWQPLGVSSVLVGSSSGGGLPVESSVRALIDGTVAANGRLTRLRVPVHGASGLATDVVAFEHLEFIERFEDRVDLIVGVLARLGSMDGSSRGAADTARQKVEYVLRPERGEGRSTARSPIDAADDVWRRIDIRAPDTVATEAVKLEFTSIGRLARAERVIGLAERSILDPLLAGAIDNDADPDVSGTLYELLVPQELKGDLGSGEHLHLLVDERTADYPWELMRPRADEQELDRPLALRVGMLRQFRETETCRFDIRRATGHNALVIGNPPAGIHAQLPGAMKESIAAATKLRQSGWNVTELIWDSAGNSVTTAPPAPATPAAAPAAPAADSKIPPIRALHQLLNGDWRVVHIAAHGQLSGDATSTGVVLGDLRLTANVFSKLSVVPDLVVLNSCHLGRVLTGANRVAASVGRTLLQLGVRAVVVAGWAVNDAAAEAFAGALYASLVQGDDFGHAVSAARLAAWKARPASLTWGAYQCYGDPGFCLTTRTQGHERPAAHTVGELRRRIQRLSSKASDQGRAAAETDAPGSRLPDELRRLERDGRALEAPPEALTDLADAWAELAQFRRAIARYRTAVGRGGPNVTVRSIEQLGNLLSRRAQQLHRRGLENVSRAEDARAEKWLQQALALGPSAERLALMGGLHKRRATRTAGADRATNLAAAVGYFAAAQRVDPRSYYELNWRQLVQVAKLNGVAVDETEPVSRASASREGLVRLASAAPDFWLRAAAGDRLLTDLLVDAAAGRDGADAFDESARRVVAAYLAAFRLRSSARERDSVTGHLADLVDLAPADSLLATSLQKIRAELESWALDLAASGSGGE